MDATETSPAPLFACEPSPGLQHAFRAPDLLTQTPPRLHDLIAKLQSFIPLCLHACTPAARLQTSIPLRLHAPGPAACLQSSIPLHLYVPTPAAPTARLGGSIPLHLHVSGPASHFQSSGALEANTSASTHLQHASRAPELSKQTPPRLHACSASPELRSSIPLRLHVCTLAARLHTARCNVVQFLNILQAVFQAFTLPRTAVHSLQVTPPLRRKRSSHTSVSFARDLATPAVSQLKHRPDRNISEQAPNVWRRLSTDDDDDDKRSTMATTSGLRWRRQAVYKGHDKRFTRAATSGLRWRRQSNVLKYVDRSSAVGRSILVKTLDSRSPLA